MNESENRNSEPNYSEFIEKRKAERKKLIVDVQFEGGEATGIANTTDISTGGLFFKTNTHLEIGAFIVLRITLSGRSFILHGNIAYAEPEVGYGVSFQELSPDTVSSLENELKLL